MSTKAVLGGIVENGEEDDETERLCMFVNSVSVDIFFASVDYRLLSSNEDIL